MSSVNSNRLLRLLRSLHLIARDGPDDLSCYRRVWLDLFIIANLAFLALDIFVAHSTNHFRQSAEWLPFVFSLLAPVVLALAAWFRQKQHLKFSRILAFCVGGTAIVVGLSGLILHLESQFFQQMTLKSLVYTAPFAAPLAYAGLGLLIFLNQLVDAGDPGWSRQVLVLAWWGFLGNFVLVLADHAQNGFFIVGEWLPVAVSALGLSVLGVLLIAPRVPPLFLKICGGVLLLQIIVGVLGFAWHTYANWPAVGTPGFDDFVYGAPVFAPLLFPNLAILAALGLWKFESPVGV